MANSLVSRSGIRCSARAESGPQARRRFSRFKFVLGEAGVCWLPYGLDRMDEEYGDRYSPLGLSMKPSEL